MSSIALPSPAPACTSTSWPRPVSSRTPAGVIATRNSSVLISVGMPTLIASSCLSSSRLPGSSHDALSCVGHLEAAGAPLELGEQIVGVDAGLGRMHADGVDAPAREQPYERGGWGGGGDDPAAEPPVLHRRGQRADAHRPPV